MNNITKLIMHGFNGAQTHVIMGCIIRHNVNLMDREKK